MEIFDSSKFIRNEISSKVKYELDTQVENSNNIQEFLAHILNFLKSCPKSEFEVFENKFQNNLDEYLFQQNKKLIFFYDKAEKIKIPMDFDLHTLRIEIHSKILELIHQINGISKGLRRTDYELKILIKVIIRLYELASMPFTKLVDFITLDYFALSKEIIKDSKTDLISVLRWNQKLVSFILEEINLNSIIESKEVLIHNLHKLMTLDPSKSENGSILALSRSTFLLEKNNISNELHKIINSAKSKSGVSIIQKQITEMQKEFEKIKFLNGKIQISTTNNIFENSESKCMNLESQNKLYSSILTEIKNFKNNNLNLSKEKFTKIMKYSLDMISKSNSSKIGISPKQISDIIFEILEFVIKIEESGDLERQISIKGIIEEKYKENIEIQKIISLFQSKKNKESCIATLNDYRDHSHINFEDGDDMPKLSFKPKFSIGEFQKSPLNDYFIKKSYKTNINPFDDLMKKYDSENSQRNKTNSYEFDLSSGFETNLDIFIKSQQTMIIQFDIRNSCTLENYEIVFQEYFIEKNLIFFDFEFSKSILDSSFELISTNFNTIAKQFNEKIQNIKLQNVKKENRNLKILIPFYINQFKAFFISINYHKKECTYFSLYRCNKDDILGINTLLEKLLNFKIEVFFENIILTDKIIITQLKEYQLPFYISYMIMVEESVKNINIASITRFKLFLSSQLSKHFIYLKQEMRLNNITTEIYLTMNDHPYFSLNYFSLTQEKCPILNQIQNFLINFSNIKKQKRTNLFGFSYQNTSLYAAFENGKATIMSFDQRIEFNTSLIAEIKQKLEENYDFSFSFSTITHSYLRNNVQLSLGIWSRIILQMGISSIEAFKIILKSSYPFELIINTN